MKINDEKTKLSHSTVQKNLSDRYINRLWQRIPVIIQAIILGTLVCEIGIITWLVIITLIPVPWSILIMIIVFWVYWKYFSGSWGPRSTVEARKVSFRSIKMSTSVWKWGLVAALLLVVIVQSGLVLTFRIIDFPAETFTMIDYDLFPPWFVVVFIIMAAFEAGIFEEVGFRGYMQVQLEKHYGSIVGIMIVSMTFVVLHLHQVWAPPILIHLFVISVLFGILAYTSGSLIPGIIGHTIIDIFSWAYWWSGVAENFEMQTIFETGIDSHFIIWLVILMISTIFFFWAVCKLPKFSQQTIEEEKIAIPANNQ